MNARSISTEEETSKRCKGHLGFIPFERQIFIACPGPISCANENSKQSSRSTSLSSAVSPSLTSSFVRVASPRCSMEQSIDVFWACHGTFSRLCYSIIARGRNTRLGHWTPDAKQCVRAESDERLGYSSVDLWSMPGEVEWMEVLDTCWCERVKCLRWIEMNEWIANGESSRWPKSDHHCPMFLHKTVVWPESSIVPCATLRCPVCSRPIRIVGEAEVMKVLVCRFSAALWSAGTLVYLNRNERHSLTLGTTDGSLPIFFREE